MAGTPPAQAAPSKGKALAWGGFAVILIIWAFIMGLLVGQGAILDHEQMAAVRSFLGLGQSKSALEEPPQVRVDSAKPEDFSFFQGVRSGKPAGLPKPAGKKPAQPVAEVPAPFRPKAPASAAGTTQAAPEAAPPSTPAAPTTPVAPAGEAPQADAASQAAPAPPEASPKGAAQPDGRFAVQVASYKKYTQAKALADRLVKAGYEARVIKAELPNLGARHRVRLGPVKDLSQAQSLVKGIRNSFKLEAYVIKVR